MAQSVFPNQSSRVTRQSVIKHYEGGVSEALATYFFGPPPGGGGGGPGNPVSATAAGHLRTAGSALPDYFQGLVAIGGSNVAQTAGAARLTGTANLVASGFFPSAGGAAAPSMDLKLAAAGAVRIAGTTDLSILRSVAAAAAGLLRTTAGRADLSNFAQVSLSATGALGTRATNGLTLKRSTSGESLMALEISATSIYEALASLEITGGEGLLVLADLIEAAIEEASGG